jgi:hypothetical protein
MRMKGDCNECRISSFLNMSILKRCIWRIVMSHLHVTIIMMCNSAVRIVSFLDKSVVYVLTTAVCYITPYSKRVYR